jgi:hypothetical protein
MHQLDEFMQKARSQKDLQRFLFDNDATFRWISDCKDDIKALANNVRAHMRLWEAIVAGDTRDVAERAEYCAVHRPVFTTQITFSNFLSPAGFKFPSAPNVSHVSLHTDGEHEAVLQMIHGRGDFQKFLLVSPHVYRFSHIEQLFLSTIQRSVDQQQSARTRTRFLGTARAFLLTPELLLLFLPVVEAQQTTADPALPRILAAARAALRDRDDSPSSLRDGRAAALDRAWLWRACVAAAEGSRVHFLFLRQSFAAHIGAAAYLRFLFAAQLPALPGIAVFGRQMRAAIPGFFQFEHAQPQMPLTGAVRALLPEWVVRGSMAAAWGMVADACARHWKTVAVVVAALLPDGVGQEATAEVGARAAKMAEEAREDTEKTDDGFPIALIGSLIETATNSLSATPFAYSWL